MCENRYHTGSGLGIKSNIDLNGRHKACLPAILGNLGLVSLFSSPVENILVSINRIRLLCLDDCDHEKKPEQKDEQPVSKTEGWRRPVATS